MLAIDSLKSSFAKLPPQQRKAALLNLSDEEVDELLHTWELIARPEQLAPKTDWATWLYLAGRGSGKTRSGAEWVRDLVKQGFGRIALVAPTTADARKVMVEGVSGIMSVSWDKDVTYAGSPMGRPTYQPSLRQLTWANGAQATTYSAEEPNRLRGPAHDAAWCDELAAWDDPQACWDMIMFGLREGVDPRVMVTTTPRPIPIVRALVRDPTSAVTRGTTWDNEANLAKKFFKTIVARYQGTRLGRQELSGEIIEEVEGALWRRDMIRNVDKMPDMLRIVVAIDPATSVGGESALTGIIVAGLGVNLRGYVLADYSGRMTPGEWGAKAVQAYDDWRADAIIGEGNQGGLMVAHTVETVRKGITCKIVHAHRGKQARAEPVASLYELGRVDHVGAFPELEDQFCTWEPLTGVASPDRLDAAVWALTELAIADGDPVFTVDESKIILDPVRIPSHWPRALVVDTDNKRFTALWAAWDRASDLMYLYGEYDAVRLDLPIHADAIRKRGAWVPGMFELEGRDRTKDAGIALAEQLVDLRLSLNATVLDLASGIEGLNSRFRGNRIKVFSTCTAFISEMRQYRRDEEGELPTEGDHLIRSAALLVAQGDMIASTENKARSDERGYESNMDGRSAHTGY